MAKDRRSFLKTAGMAAAVTSAAPLAFSLTGEPRGIDVARAAPNPRAIAGARFALELDGAVVGVLAGYSGGFPIGTVVEFQDGGGGPPNKLIRGVRFQDIMIEAGPGMGPALWDWVAATVGGDPTSRSGAIVVADFNYDVRYRLEFENAWIAEFRVPALDAASKEPVNLTVVIAPETTAFVPASGKLGAAVAKQKLWQASNFRLSVGDLPTSRAITIEPLVVKQQISEVSEGGGGPPQRVPGRIEFPNLSFTIPTTDAAAWFDYFEEFVLDSTGTERQGMLELLAADSSVAWTLELMNLGIFKCQFEDQESASDNVARVTVEMYVEGMAFDVAV